MADIIELIYADHDWLRRQFFRLDDATSDAELQAIWSVLGARLDAIYKRLSRLHQALKKCIETKLEQPAG